MDYFLRDTDDVLLELQTSESGLTVSEATRRLAEYGRNELEKAKRKPLIIRLLSQLVDPMVIILLVAALVSAIIAAYSGGGLHEYADVAIILAVVVINSILGVYQENKAENAIDALQQMSATTAKVRRDNDVLVVQSAELVIGDIVLVEAGDVVPADIRLIECASLRTEEAALTGESLAVDKQTEAISSKTGKVALGDRTNMIYMGSDIVAGRAEGVVVATAMKTEMGSIASLIQTTEDGETPLQIKLAQLSKILTYAVLGICAIVFVIDLIHDGKISTDSLLDSFMIAVSLAVAAIPEGLVAVVTIVLSIGVTNMANRRAIIRRLTAVETLRCAQVICTDKTGTLTQNKMTVVEVYGSTDLLVPAMALCTDSQLSSYGEIIGEPTENALVAKAIDAGVDFTALKLAEPRVAEVPFDSTRKMMTTIHQTDQGIIQYTKGAPDVILGLCTHVLIDNTRVVEINDELMIAITQRMSRYAADALRVLAAAYREWDELPEEISTQTVERGMVFIGLAAMHDPVRPEVKGAIDQCRAAGIQVVMITGDHVDTAAAIGKQLGIIYRSDQAITGYQLGNMSDEVFEKRVEDIFVYARVQPEHKVRIVNMWRKKGYVTAMTGDGVNDAPAIKSGDIGVGMGISGTDVTKNVADMVLADDNFATIVAAVEEGRIIYDNIRRTIQFLLGTNLSEVIAVFVASLMGFVIFKPVHLLYINLITDSIPAIALGMEVAETDVMTRPPRKTTEGIFADGMAFDIIYRGIAGAALALLAYVIVDIWEGHEVAMTSAFLAMTLGEMFHAFNMRSRRQSVFSLKSQNKLLWVAVPFSLVMCLITIYVPPVSRLFSLAPLSLPELAVALGLSVMIIPLVEVVKLFQRRNMAKNQPIEIKPEIVGNTLHDY